MASSRQPWPPYPFATTRDCSLGICSNYCFQNCYLFFPPPPSSSSSSGSPTLSPLLIAVIAVLATAFLLVAYYAILSKYRRRFQSLSASRPSPSAAAAAEAALQAAPRDGLDESLINRIAVHKYRAGDGLAAAGSTDCSVCLAEFRDGESLRLLPKCGHAFHLPCIDTWLKSHSSCPLCRACIVPPATSTQEPTTVLRQLLDDGQADSTAAEESESASATEVGSGGGAEEEANCSGIEIGEDGARAMRRSLSMDSSFLRAAADSIAETGSSRWSRALSFSGGRLSSSRNGRGRSAILPI